jgi:hypothetical protein
MPSVSLSIFEIITGVVEVGWCDFTVRVDTASWKCRASYIGQHPLHDLIHSAIDLYTHIFEAPLEEEDAVWDCRVTDEPGGILIRAIPEWKNVRVQIFDFQSDDSFWPEPKTSPAIPPVADTVVEYWSYAEAIFHAAARAIARQGFTGLREAWEPHGWDVDFHFEVLPVEHFLYLAALVRDRAPRKRMSLAEEIAILRDIEERNKS